MGLLNLWPDRCPGRRVGPDRRAPGLRRVAGFPRTDCHRIARCRSHKVEMDEDEARRRFATARVGRLATVTPNGMPHLVPVVFALVDDVLYTAVDDKPKTTKALQRLANINATGHTCLLYTSPS